MTALALTVKRSWCWSAGMLQRRITRVLGIALLVIAATWESPEARGLVLASLRDAYVQVSAFVAATLALFYGLERLFNVDTGELLERHARWQVPTAAFLGALPGCGGAIMVIAQYVRGHIGFGAVIAVLTATMGDAAFLLLAREPTTGFAVIGLGFSVGVLSGWIVDAIHGPEFLRQRHRPRATVATANDDAGSARHLNGLWVALMVLGLVLGILTAFQVDADALFGTALIPQPTVWLGVAGSLRAIAMPLIGILVDFFAGCGSQVVVTTLSLTSRGGAVLGAARQRDQQ